VAGKTQETYDDAKDKAVAKDKIEE
jgi:uncharacterized protein YjbJ (UPF0337 family)